MPSACAGAAALRRPPAALVLLLLEVALLVVVRGSVPDEVRFNITDACEASGYPSYNREYKSYAEGVNGAMIYKAVDADLWVYWDRNCDGDISDSPKWIIDFSGTSPAGHTYLPPNETSGRDLDQDGICNDWGFVMTGSSPGQMPTSGEVWKLWCDVGFGSQEYVSTVLNFTVTVNTTTMAPGAIAADNGTNVSNQSAEVSTTPLPSTMIAPGAIAADNGTNVSNQSADVSTTPLPSTMIAPGAIAADNGTDVSNQSARDAIVVNQTAPGTSVMVTTIAGTTTTTRTATAISATATLTASSTTSSSTSSAVVGARALQFGVLVEGDEAVSFAHVEAWIRSEPGTVAAAIEQVGNLPPGSALVDVLAPASATGNLRRLQGAYRVKFELRITILAVGKFAEKSDAELETRAQSLQRNAVQNPNLLVGLLEPSLPPDVLATFSSARLSPGSAPAVVLGVIRWVVGAWSSCGAGCGAPPRTRTVQCSAADAEVCAQLPPAPLSSEACPPCEDALGEEDGEQVLPAAVSGLVVAAVSGLVACCMFMVCCRWLLKTKKKGTVTVKMKRLPSGDLRAAAVKAVPAFDASYEIEYASDRPPAKDAPILVDGPADASTEASGHPAVAPPKKNVIRWTFDEVEAEHWLNGTPAQDGEKQTEGVERADGSDVDDNIVTRLSPALTDPDAPAPLAIEVQRGEVAGEAMQTTELVREPTMAVVEDEAIVFMNRLDEALHRDMPEGRNALIGAYLVRGPVEYYSNTLKMWVAGHVTDVQVGSAASSLRTGLVVELHTGQLRLDVNLDEVRPVLRIGDEIDAFSEGQWVAGQVEEYMSVVPSIGGYLVRVGAGEDSSLTRVAGTALRRRYPAGQHVQAYLGEDIGWLQAVVCAAPEDAGSVRDIVDDREQCSLQAGSVSSTPARYPLSPNWWSRVSIGGAKEPEAKTKFWTTVYLRLSGRALEGVDDERDGIWACPSFLVRRNVCPL